MLLYCHKCKTDLSVFDNFCRKCGVETPKFTIPPNAAEPAFDKRIYCPNCSKPNKTDAVYCSACGKGVYNVPIGTIVCPKCGKKNPADSRFCTGCTLDFSEWFAMKGEIADQLGLSGDITFVEKMTDTSYGFYTEGKVTIGRSSNNTIAITCPWISSRHCTLDVNRAVLTDNDSTNGTFVNCKPGKVKSIPFSEIEELNLGSTLTFRVVRSKGIFAVYLGAVLKDNDGCRKCVSHAVCEELRKRYFVFGGSGRAIIRKFDGKMVAANDPKEECYTIEIDNGKYYLSDPGKGIRSRLLLKDLSNLPENWKVDKK